MYRKILVVIDGFSGSSPPVYREAIHMARSHRARLRLLHVLPPHRPQGVAAQPTGSHRYNEESATLAIATSSLWKRFERRCMELLKRYADRATAQGINTDYRQVRGNGEQAICEAARDWSADLIILSHSAAETQHLSNPAVLAAVPCSTLFVKSGVKPAPPPTSARVTSRQQAYPRV